MGLEVAMITGDNGRTAQAIAHQVGIEKSFQKFYPRINLKKLNVYRIDGEVVAFVGDGINDAPALGSGRCGNSHWKWYRYCN